MKTEFPNGGAEISAPIGNQWIKFNRCTDLLLVCAPIKFCPLIPNRSGDLGAPIKGPIIFGYVIFLVFPTRGVSISLNSRIILKNVTLPQCNLLRKYYCRNTYYCFVGVKLDNLNVKNRNS